MAQSPHNQSVNYVPTEDEAVEIHAKIMVLSKRLDSLAELSAQVQLLRATVSPIRRIPPEVLQEIFLACLPTTQSVMHPREAPVLLCHVCGAWRAVALAFPQLWTSLHVNIGHVLRNEDRIAAFVQWLERSSPLPLSLTVWAPDFHRDPFSANSSTIAFQSALTSCADRWSTLRLMHLPFTISKPLQDISAPVLKDFTFTQPFDPDSDWEEETMEWDILKSSSLRKFSTTYPEPMRHALYLPLEWDQLTHLCLVSNEDDSRQNGGLAVRDALEILRRCAAKLVSFKSHIKRNSDMQVGEPIVLHALESFTLVSPCFAETVVVECLISSLAMPRLLSMNIIMAWTAQDSTVFLRSLATHSPLLSSLTIDLDSFTRDTLRQTLVLLPTITELRVKDIRRDFDLAGLARANGLELLLHLTLHLDDTIISPALRCLHIRQCVPLPDAVLVTFVQRRMNHLTTNISDCDIQFRGTIPDHVPDLRPFVGEGNHLSLKWYEVDREDVTPSSGLSEPFLDPELTEI
ncbi:hypothetical protein C8R47DRAFT_1140478 [Mycena vitilis]|nr:hypothetical protein C8R47DRAFT_1140478 [Mycena vitilis]